jgi:hypothetical protein
LLFEMPLMRAEFWLAGGAYEEYSRTGCRSYALSLARY